MKKKSFRKKFFKKSFKRSNRTFKKTWRIAKKAAKRVFNKQVETKWFQQAADVIFLTGVNTQTYQGNILPPITVGTGGSDRIGNQIRLKTLRVRLTARSAYTSTGTDTCCFRVFILRAKMWNNTAQMKTDNDAQFIAFTGMTGVNQSPNFNSSNVYYDSGLQIIHRDHYEFKLKPVVIKNMLIQYKNAGGSDPQDRQLVIYVVSYNPSTQFTLGLNTYVSFKDA